MCTIQIKKVLFHLILQSLFFYSPTEAYFTLADVLDADLEMQIQKPSLRISASLIGKNIKIKEEEYQIRAFVFEARPMDDSSVTELTFLEFVKKYNLHNTLASEYKPQIPPVSLRASLYPISSLLDTFERDGTWFHYMIVLGKITDSND